ncbi:MAG: alpha-glucosidase [Erysipelotrichaceae bacterium]|nr:alpha-glucosidase [Erysipelotrichaceae bacterium]
MMVNKWWHDKIVYQIYPKSFKDSNGDGVGDINGIIEKLDYLKDLGVDILWLTPFFTSPMVDNGYDVADFCDINPLFGTMEDMDKLLEETKKRDMYIMIDIVANHTSSEHRWFKEALKGKDNPFRDYYIFKDKPCNDHQSCFGGSAWEYVPSLNEYYFHEFAIEQPDLNWDNPKVREEIANAINFWMEKGVKGIRFDVIHHIGKEIENDIYGYGPKLHERVQELYRNSYGNYDIVTVGEAWGNLEQAKDFTLPERKELDMVFQFECTSYTNDHSRHGKFTPRPIDMKFVKDTLSKYQYGLNDCSWNALMVENHDLGRCINRFGDENFRVESSKAIATMNFLLKGTPYIYQGQEIGMMNIKMDKLEDYRDVEVYGKYDDLVKTGLLTHEEFMDGAYKEARDNNRIPVQWDDSKNAGFTTGDTPWIKVHPNYVDINVEKESKDPSSILNFYKKLLSLRKHSEYSPTFVYGKFDSYLDDSTDVFVYSRTDNNYSLGVITNMTNKNVEVELPFKYSKVLLSNYKKDYFSNKLLLEPFESFVVEIK